MSAMRSPAQSRIGARTVADVERQRERCQVEWHDGRRWLATDGRFTKYTGEHGPHRWAPSSIVADDFSVEVSGDDLRDDGISPARWLLMPRRDTGGRWEFRVVEQHVIGRRSFAHLPDGVAGGKLRHASPFGRQVITNHRTVQLLNRSGALDEKDREQAGIGSLVR